MTAERLRDALERFTTEAEMCNDDGDCLTCGSGFDPDDHDPSDCPVSEARATLLATPASAVSRALDVERLAKAIEDVIFGPVVGTKALMTFAEAAHAIAAAYEAER